jgi:hypothetical protein
MKTLYLQLSGGHMSPYEVEYGWYRWYVTGKYVNRPYEAIL